MGDARFSNDSSDIRRRVPFVRGVLVFLSLLSYAGTCPLPAQTTVSQDTTGSPHLALTDTLPTDTAVTIGTLPNGMRYYLRANKKPEHRAELRLVVKAGSLMEDDDQRGMAHFVEHMAFRGTTHFQGNGIVEYLKSIGVRFGADLNAETEFDHTTFILPIPTDTLAHVKQGLQILADWAHGVTFPPKDFEDERGIILGEQRNNMGAGLRVLEQMLPVVYKGSRYVARFPLGTKESITHATREQVMRFYATWYRPDRMAVVAVGDFDKREMEQLIREQFSPIPGATTPHVDPQYPLPPQPGTLTVTVRDPEITNTSVAVLYKGAHPVQHTVATWRSELVRGMFADILNQRLEEITVKPNAAFIGAEIGFQDLTPHVRATSLGVSVSDTGMVRGVNALLTEVARAAQHGLVQSELDREKQSYLAQMDNFYQNRNDRHSDEFTEACIEHFLTGEPMPSVEIRVALGREIVPAITLSDVNQMLDFWKTSDDRVVMITQPGTPTVQPPDTAALLALFQTVAAQSVETYVDHVTDSPLLAPLPTPGKVVSERTYPAVGVTEWTLSNGAVVFLKPTDFMKDEILFAGNQLGGLSLLPDSLFPTAAFINQIVDVGGLGTFSSVDLGRRLTGKIAQVDGGVGEGAEELSGSTTWKDVETMLQLVHLKVTQPRYDSATIVSLVQRLKPMLMYRSADPDAVFQDTVSATMSQHSRRVPIPTVALIDQIDAKRAFTLYQDRFADASGFAFMFVGSFSPDSLKPLVEHYLASLPSLQRHEHVHDVPSAHAPPGVIRTVVTAGVDPKTETLINFSGSYDGTRETTNALRVLTDVLENRLENRLREQMAQTYGVSVQLALHQQPTSEYGIAIQFVADPSRREEMIRETFAVIDSLKRDGPTADELQRVVAPIRRTRQKARKTNEYWLGILDLYRRGWDFGATLDDSLLQTTTPSDIQRAAQRYLDVHHYQQFSRVPAEAATGNAPKPSGRGGR